MKNKQKTLVTGATGFIGGRVVEVLHLTKSRQVRAAIRQWSTAARLGRFPVDIVRMDLGDKDAIKTAMQGVTEIIHCAKGSAAVTIEGTQNLLEIALQNKIRRFVHLSTADVYGDVSGIIDEDTEFSYTGTEYNRTKIEAEKLVWSYHKKGLPVTVLRPSIVYGPFSTNWTTRFAKLFLAGKWGIYEDYGEGQCNLVYIDDLLKAIFLALDRNEAVGQAFNISGPEIITWNEYFQLYNEKIGLPALRKVKRNETAFQTAIMEPVRIFGRILRDHFMTSLKKVADTSGFAKKIMKQTENALRTSPSSDDLKLFNKKAMFCPDKSRKLLQFNPSVPVDVGLSWTVEWLRHQGLS